MRRIRSVIFFILITLLFIEIWIGFPISIETQPPNRKAIIDEKNAGEAEQKMKGVQLFESKEGRRDWQLTAKAADGYEGKGIWELQAVKVLFYFSKRVDYTVIGDRGSIDSKTKDMKIQGNVKTTTANGYEILTESIFYVAKERKLSSPDKIVMRSPSNKKEVFLVEGVGIEAFVDKQEVEIKSQVVATHPLKEGIGDGSGQKREFKITSETAHFNTRDYTAIFKGKVKLSIGDMKIEGPVAVFKYKKGYDLLQSVAVDGGVRVQDKLKTAVADTLKYDPEQDSYVFVGKPRVTQGQDEIIGDQITFLDGGRKVLVDKMKARVEQNKEEQE